MSMLLALNSETSKTSTGAHLGEFSKWLLLKKEARLTVISLDTPEKNTAVVDEAAEEFYL